MTGLQQRSKFAARLALLALTRPVEFYDRTIGRRERAHQGTPPTLNARALDPIAAAHEAIGETGCTSCDSELAEVRTSILSRLTGSHHHDGGSSLAEMAVGRRSAPVPDCRDRDPCRGRRGSKGPLDLRPWG